MVSQQFPSSLGGFFQETFQLTNHEMSLISDKFQYRHLAKKDFYLHQGQIIQSKAFLLQGVVRIYYTDDNLKENVLFFRFENSWLGDVESYHEQTPSRINIQAIEPCEIAVISKSDFHGLEQYIPALHQWYSANAVKMYASLFNKLIEAKLRTPEEKYLHILRHEPQILHRVPLQDIAAYLEIEPQSFSRLSKRMMQQGK